MTSRTISEPTFCNFKKEKAHSESPAVSQGEVFLDEDTACELWTCLIAGKSFNPEQKKTKCTSKQVHGGKSLIYRFTESRPGFPSTKEFVNPDLEIKTKKKKQNDKLFVASTILTHCL